MENTENIINIILPYCGEAEGIDQNAWLDAVANNTPTQLKSKLWLIASTSSNKERYYNFKQRCIEIFDYVVEVPRYKVAPTTVVEAVAFSHYCFMTTWASYQHAGSGILIHPLWLPKEKFWADNFINVMRIKQKDAIALAVFHETKKSDIFGCLGYSANFFRVFSGYNSYIANVDLFERISWEFKKHGFHMSSEGYPFEKVDSADYSAPDVFLTAKSKPAKEVVKLEPVTVIPQEEIVKESAEVSVNEPVIIPEPDFGDEHEDIVSGILVDDSLPTEEEMLANLKGSLMATNNPKLDNEEIDAQDKLSTPAKKAPKKKVAKKAAKKAGRPKTIKQ